MAFEDTKGALTSAGVTGSIMTVAVTALGVLQYFEVLPLELLDDTLALVIAFVGGVVSLIGRWKAETKIKGLF